MLPSTARRYPNTTSGIRIADKPLSGLTKSKREFFRAAPGSNTSAKPLYAARRASGIGTLFALRAGDLSHGFTHI
jgi:hypothetical protein